MNKEMIKKELLKYIKEEKLILSKDNYHILPLLLKLLHKKGVKKINLLFPEENVLTIHEALPYIESAKLFCLKHNIEFKALEEEYKKDKPYDLLDSYDDVNIGFQKGNFENINSSVVIPYYNRRKYLLKTLDGLKKQTRTDFEVIIVDDGSEESVIDCLKVFDLNIKYLYWKRKKPFVPGTPYNRAGPCRNLGVKYAVSGIIIFLDCDIVVNQEFITEHIKSQGSADIVIGTSIREKEGKDAREPYFFLCEDDIAHFQIPWTLCHEGNISMKKHDFLDVGGFSSDFVYWAVEGDDLAYKLINYTGKKVVLNRKACGMHLWHPPESVDENTRLKGMIYNGTVLYKKHLDKEIYDRYFIRAKNHKYEDMVSCILQEQPALNFVERMTDCIELKKCKHVRQCRCRPELLKQLLQKNAEVFFRFDDVYEKDENLFELMDFFVKNKIPINLEIVPARLKKELIEKIKKVPKELIEVHQHGWMHNNYSDIKVVGGENKYEFGKKRGYKEQYEDIINGKTLLEKEFGNRFYPIFTPPFHGYDNNTLKILDELGLRLSAWEKGPYSANVDVMEHYKGKNGFKKEGKIIKEIINTEGDIGIVLHTNYLNKKSIQIIKNIIKIMKANKNIGFIKMSQIESFFIESIKQYLKKPKLNNKRFRFDCKTFKVKLKETNRFKLWFINADEKETLLVKTSEDKILLEKIWLNYNKLRCYEFIRTIYDYQEKDIFQPALFMEFIDGRYYDIKKDGTKDIARILSKIHNTHIKNQNYTSYSKIKVKIDEIIKNLEKEDFLIFDLKSLKNRLLRNLEKYRPLEKSLLCHCDFCRDNILITRTKSIKIIDLESVDNGEPAIDIIQFLISSNLNLNLNDIEAKKFIDHYLSNSNKRDNDLLDRICLLYPLILIFKLEDIGKIKMDNKDLHVQFLLKECFRYKLLEYK